MPQSKAMGEFDAILIPGGGLAAGGALPPWVVNRLDRALELQGGALLIALSAGTPHRPTISDTYGRPLFESTAAARYLISRGADPEKLLTEACSLDTIGNAYFSRVIHVGPRGLANLLVVTSEFHLARTEAAFRWVYNLPPAPGPVRLTFEAVPNVGIASGALAARRAREQESLARLETLSARHRDLQSFHRWLFREHRAYTPAPEAPPAHVDGQVLDTY